MNSFARLIRKAVALAGALLLACSVPTACSRHAKPSAKQLDWLKRNVIPVATVEPGHGLADLQALQEVIGDARVVSLGESTHGNREIFQMKHRLIEYLASEMGFTILSIEANMPESQRLNDYVMGRGGDPVELTRGMKCQPYETEEVLALVEWMRVFNSKEKASGGARKLEFTGFDMQYPELSIEIVRDFARKADPALAARVEQAIALMNARKAVAPLSTFYGALPAAPFAGRKMVFSGWIRTENMQSGRACLWLNLYGPKGKMSFSDLMEKRGPRGTTPWKRFEIALTVPKETAFIDFGLGSGDGTAWFDDLEVRVDGREYADDRFDFGFEGNALKGLKLEGTGWTADLDAARPHSGRQSLRVQRLSQVGAEEHLRMWTGITAGLESGRARYAAQSGADETARALMNASVVTQSVMMTTQTDFRKRMEQRDRFMADNVRRTLDHDPKAKIILWAHIVHAAREKPWMGSHLEEMLPGQMKVLGVWVGQGECLIRIKNTSQTGPHRLKPVHPGSLESFFGAIGQPVFIVDLKRAVPGSAESGWLAQERPIRVVDWEGNEMHDAAMIPKVCDAIVYVDRGTPALPLKVAARAK